MGERPNKSIIENNSENLRKGIVPIWHRQKKTSHSQTHSKTK